MGLIICSRIIHHTVKGKMMFEAIIASVLGGTACSVIIRYVIIKYIDHAFEVNRMKMESTFESMLSHHESKLTIWSTQQIELFRSVVHRRIEVSIQLLYFGSRVRKLIENSSTVEELQTIDQFYGQFCDLFYMNQNLFPKTVYELVHEYRRVMETAIGARKSLPIENIPARDIVESLNGSYFAMLDSLRHLLIPDDLSIYNM
jgi:hypothetical protein